VEILLVLSSGFLCVVNFADEALCRFIRINKAPPLQNFAAIMTPNHSVISTNVSCLPFVVVLLQESSSHKMKIGRGEESCI
jgi:hypothetical protein